MVKPMNTLFRLTLTALVAVTAVAASAAGDSAPAANNIDSALKKPIVVEFVVTDGTDMIDFTGPAEVFNFVQLPGQGDSPYITYIVSDKLDPVKLLGGFVVTPSYTFDTAPPADLVFVPGHGPPFVSPTQKELDWLEARHDRKQTIISVCTGAIDLARAGLLDGKQATTHHGVFPYFQKHFPAVTIAHGKRYVQADPNLFTAGGLSSGIDLALHLVDLRFGRTIAEQTAGILEYQGTGWTTNTSTF
jgi:transcriptional regulator GlxA family with amidase domain